VDLKGSIYRYPHACHGRKIVREPLNVLKQRERALNSHKPSSTPFSTTCISTRYPGSFVYSDSMTRHQQHLSLHIHCTLSWHSSKATGQPQTKHPLYPCLRRDVSQATASSIPSKPRKRNVWIRCHIHAIYPSSTDQASETISKYHTKQQANATSPASRPAAACLPAAR